MLAALSAVRVHVPDARVTVRVVLLVMAHPVPDTL